VYKVSVVVVIYFLSLALPRWNGNAGLLTNNDDERRNRGGGNDVSLPLALASVRGTSPAGILGTRNEYSLSLFIRAGLAFHARPRA
jgi:hypothetical protein